MKIQINSLAALERLIGDDPEIELEIRNSVKDSFMKTTAKNLKTANFINSLVEAQIFDEEKVSGSYYGTKRKVFKPDIKNMVQQEIARAVVEITKDIIKNHLDEIVKARVNQMLSK